MRKNSTDLPQCPLTYRERQLAWGGHKGALIRAASVNDIAGGVILAVYDQQVAVR
jgi:hypothetical protein